MGDEDRDHLNCEFPLCRNGGSGQASQRPAPPKPVSAIRLLRPMRGGSQARLVEGSDCRYYVTKFFDNPQGGRILANDFLGANLFRALGISTAPAATVQFSAQFLRENPLHIQHPRRSAPVTPGSHFGSLYPGDPGQLAVHDLFPRALLKQVVNLSDFQGALVADLWLGNIDARQAIFYQVSHRWTCRMIDFGQILGGNAWTFAGSPRQGLHFDPAVYQMATSFEVFEPWLSRVENVQEPLLERIASLIPEEWIPGERSLFEGILEKLANRRSGVASLVDGFLRIIRDGPF